MNIYLKSICYILLGYGTHALAIGNECLNGVKSVYLYGTNQNVFTPIAEDRTSFFERWELDGARHKIIRDSAQIREFMTLLKDAEIIDTLNFTTTQSGNEYFVSSSCQLLRKTHAKEPIGAIIINYDNNIPYDIIWICRKTMYAKNMEYAIPEAILGIINSIEKRPSKNIINLLKLRYLPY